MKFHLVYDPMFPVRQSQQTTYSRAEFTALQLKISLESVKRRAPDFGIPLVLCCDDGIYGLVEYIKVPDGQNGLSWHFLQFVVPVPHIPVSMSYLGRMAPHGGAYYNDGLDRVGPEWEAPCIEKHLRTCLETRPVYCTNTILGNKPKARLWTFNERDRWSEVFTDWMLLPGGDFTQITAPRVYSMPPPDMSPHDWHKVMQQQSAGASLPDQRANTGTLQPTRGGYVIGFSPIMAEEIAPDIDDETGPDTREID